jgi:hypothetical protein
LGAIFGLVVSLLSVAPIGTDQASVKQVKAHVELVTMGLEVRLRCLEPHSSAFKDFLAFVGIFFVVFEVAVEAFEEALAPLLLMGALKHVVVGFLILTTRAKVAGGPPLLVQAVESR